jgi:hypothetical protein
VAADFFADEVFQFLVKEGIAAPATQHVLGLARLYNDGLALALGTCGEELLCDASSELHIRKEAGQGRGRTPYAETCPA